MSYGGVDMVTQVFEKSKYRAKLTRNASDIKAAQRLRYRAFINPDGEGLDRDGFDDLCWHVLIEDQKNNELVACYRLLPLENGRDIESSYSAQFYDLTALKAYPGRMVEMGRFCITPGLRDPEILRTAWALMTRYVDDEGIAMMFGCSSFRGTDPAPYLDAFALLGRDHIAPERWQPRLKAANVFAFGPESGPEINEIHKINEKRARRLLPPLLRTYLVMGGWVSDHAVIDADMNTLHVFTGLEVSAVPDARARNLRASAS